MDDDRTTPFRIGGALRDARNRAGLNQDQASVQAGIGKQSLLRYEKDQRETPLSIIQRLAEVYGTTLEIILGLAERPTSYVAVRGYVSAGNPRESWEVDLGTVLIDNAILHDHPKCFALQISGNSLEGDAIGDGDIVVVDPEAAYQVDKIYIVRLENGEVTAKHLTIDENNQITLRASNNDYEDLKVTGQVLGRVVCHIRRM
ncbi:MAG: LexA family transcriptional regulator [Chloroflexi bacterium]|nr:LexA family transcriptional regulator [Chloroflexota bacterium]